MTRTTAALGLGLLVGAIAAAPIAVAAAPQHQATPMVCTGTMGPLGGDLHCAPAGPTIPHSPTTSPSPVMAGSASPTPTPTKTPTATPTSTTPTPTPSPTATGGKKILAYVTGYSFWDNTPPGSAQISNPVLHKTAGGTGSWQDPITVAVGHTLSGGNDILDWPAGTRWYDPLLRVFLITEDTCGDGSHPQDGPCHVLEPDAKAAGAVTWLDIYVDGAGFTSSAADKCMGRMTGVRTVILDPPSTLPVTVGPIVSAKGCL